MTSIASAHNRPLLPPPQHGAARLPARSARGRRPLRSGPTTLGAHGAAAFSFLGGPRIESPTSSGTGPGPPARPWPRSRADGPLKRGRAALRRGPRSRPDPRHPPASIFSSRPKAPRPEEAAAPFPRPLRRSGGPAPFLPHPVPVLLRLPPSLTRGEGVGMSWRVSPWPPQVSLEPGRHFLLANTPERWAGTHLPATIETNMAANAKLERLALRPAPGGLRRPLAPPPGLAARARARAPSRPGAGRESGRFGPGRRPQPPRRLLVAASLRLRGNRSSSPHSR